MDSEVQGIAGMLRHAKTELKKSKRVDYYKLLDISQDASENDIKKVVPQMICNCIGQKDMGLCRMCLKAASCIHEAPKHGNNYPTACRPVTACY